MVMDVSQRAVKTASPFHLGEQHIHEKLGVKDRMEAFGRQVVRDHMPEQHRQFYQQLPFVFLGYQDPKGQVWASILHGEPGFMHSPNPEQLIINAQPVKGDPLNEALVDGMHLGMLGIELPTRRRNRLSARLLKREDEKENIKGSVKGNKEALQLNIVQSFGNCPQYIQTREIVPFDDSSRPDTPEVESLTALDFQTRQLIENADTFFVASHTFLKNDLASSGADVSHRGGKPGFIRVDDNSTLTIPDYLGNFHFNTFGNFEVNPAAGLLFFDFEHGHILSLTGTAEVLWDDPDTQYFEGAERLWRFKITEGRWIKHGLPFKWQFGDYANTTKITGTWETLNQAKSVNALSNQWQKLEVTDVVKESDLVKSFSFKSHSLHKPQSSQTSLNALPLPKSKAGQHITVRASINGKEEVRSYTLSSAPEDEAYRISVKREDNGLFSNYLHANIQVGDSLHYLAPSGDFFIHAQEERPAVLLAAGIGITPMIAMVKHALNDVLRTRHLRPITLICAAKNSSEQCFVKELDELVKVSSGLIRVFWAFSEPLDTALKADQPGKDFHCKGRISTTFLQAVLPLANYDFYLCGPNQFMQDMYRICIDLGVRDEHIFAESFGESTLIRNSSSLQESKPKGERAESAIVSFNQSQFEQAWVEQDGTLLEFAEAHGLTPDYGCRGGRCGSCVVKKIAGEVFYKHKPLCDVGNDEVVLCCAFPAKGQNAEDTVKIEINV